jgi:hypothetical protein
VLAAVAPAGGQIPTLWALEIRGDLTWLSKSGRWRRSGGTAGMRHISIARPSLLVDVCGSGIPWIAFPPAGLGLLSAHASRCAMDSFGRGMSATASSLSSDAPSPRQALPCMQASVVGCSLASLSKMAVVLGACAK